MIKTQQKFMLGLISILFGIPISMFISVLTDKLFIVDNGNCYEYRFQILSPILDFFYDRYHYESNLLNFGITILLGFYLSYLFVKLMFKILNRHRE